MLVAHAAREHDAAVPCDDIGRVLILVGALLCVFAWLFATVRGRSLDRREAVIAEREEHLAARIVAAADRERAALQLLAHVVDAVRALRG